MMMRRTFFSCELHSSLFENLISLPSIVQCVCIEPIDFRKSMWIYRQRGRPFVVLSYLRPNHDEQCASISLRCPMELFSVCVWVCYSILTMGVRERIKQS